jgi:GTPase SAR1 family protein
MIVGILGVLFSLMFWFGGKTRIKTITILAIVQWASIEFGTRYPGDLDPLMVNSYALTGLVLIYFVFSPVGLEVCSFWPSIGALVGKLLLDFMLVGDSQDIVRSNIYIYDSVFVAMLYFSIWVSYGLHTLGNLGDDRNKRIDEEKKLTEIRSQEAAMAKIDTDKKNAELAEESAFQKTVSQNPMGSLQNLLGSFVKDYPEIRATIESSLQDISRLKTTQTVTLAIVGEFSSGKSTFINSILGRDLLQFSNDECTCVPVKILAADKEVFSECRQGQWYEIPEKLYQSRQTSFDETVDSLQAKISSAQLANLDIEIVDTPGASSKDSRYEARTLDAIENSDACIVLMDSAQDGSKSFMTFLESVKARQKRIYLLLSRADMRTKSELQEHIELTLPKLSARLGIKQSEIFFVGLKESEPVKAPVTAFKIIGEGLRGQRNEILNERVGHLSAKLKASLNPAIAKVESGEASRLKAAQDTPASFEEMWEKWINLLESLPWEDLSYDMYKFCEQCHESVYNELRHDLKPRIDEIWLDSSRRNRVASEFSAHSLEKFGSLIREHLKILMEPHLKRVDEAADKTVFAYIANVHKVQQNAKSLGDIVFNLTEENRERLEKSSPEESIRLFVGVRLATYINANLKVKGTAFSYDNAGFGKAGGRAGAMAGMGHPLLGLGVALVGAVMAKSEADETFWKQISEWFTGSCIERRKAIVSLVEQFPGFLKERCDDLTKALRNSKLPLLSTFEQINQQRALSEQRLKLIGKTIKVLEHISSISNGDKRNAA